MCHLVHVTRYCIVCETSIMQIHSRQPVLLGASAWLSKGNHVRCRMNGEQRHPLQSTANGLTLFVGMSTSAFLLHNNHKTIWQPGTFRICCTAAPVTHSLWNAGWRFSSCRSAHLEDTQLGKAVLLEVVQVQCSVHWTCKISMKCTCS